MKPSCQTAGRMAKHSRLARPANELLPIDDPRRAMIESGLILSLPGRTFGIAACEDGVGTLEGRSQDERGTVKVRLNERIDKRNARE
jgi:hypothetical protein